MDRLTLIEDLLAERAAVLADYGELFAPGLDIVPIPFFGRIDTARILTVGLNPSDGELRKGEWPSDLTPAALDEKLLAYFNAGLAAAYSWFLTWEQALAYADVSYADGTAAHIDLAPWPTIPWSSLPPANRVAFDELIEAEARWLFPVIEASPMAVALFVAGSAPRHAYLHRAVAYHARRVGATLTGKWKAPGRAFVVFQTLELGARRLPVFYCSVSPSDWARNGLLIERAAAYSTRLKALVAGADDRA